MASEVASIIADLKSRKFSPVYFFCGEEPYFIDQLIAAAEAYVIPEAEKAFNETVLYGKDVNRQQVIESCRRLPMMAERQLVIIKEAQYFKDLEELIDYVRKPVPSTVLIISYKGKTPDKRKVFGKEISKLAVYFESKGVYENQVAPIVRDMAKSQKLKLDDEALQVLIENVGTDLGTLANELSKLKIAIGDTRTITVSDIEGFTGLSREYNAFALNQPLGTRQERQVHKVVQYYSSNPKSAPMVLILGSLFGYFQKLYVLASHKGASERDAASLLGVAPFAVKDYFAAIGHYSLAQLEQVFLILEEFDLRSKGVENGDIPQEELMKELALRILHL
ncbi:MAG: DNA polymerase III subunit delta [Chitinophagales bacterium]